jgi:hypothetical protein
VIFSRAILILAPDRLKAGAHLGKLETKVQPGM